MVWTALISPVVSILDKFIEDKDQKNKLAHEIATLAEKQSHELNVGQIDINKTEALHRSVWVAGWRPCLGWVASLSFAWIFLLQPIAQWILILCGNSAVLPSLQTDVLMELTFALLGMAGLRSWEKSKGLTK